VLGSATKIGQSGEVVESVTYTKRGTNEVNVIPVTDVIVAAGPWTPSVFPSALISSSRNHSVILRPA